MLPTVAKIDWPVERPWGTFQVLYQGSNITVKHLALNPKSSLSLQKHEHRAESWYFTSLATGMCKVIIGDEELKAAMDRRYFIPRGVVHRIVNDTNTFVELVEVAFGDFDEDDIIRLDDNYGRAQ